MTFPTIVGIAVGLAMDAFAVSIAAGLKLGCVTGRQTLRMAFHFGFFQFMMPILGWMAGAAVESYIRPVDHWVAMGLLSFIGGKMIYEALRPDGMEKVAGDPTRGATLYALSVATSIDALAVGLSLALIGENVIYPAVIIGIVAAAFTVAGLELGCRLGSRFSGFMEITGGIVLILIGLKILLDHTLFVG